MTNTKKLEKQHLGFIGAAIAAIVLMVAVVIPALTSATGPTVRQGTTSSYGVLAATTITNTGTTTMSGTAGSDVGLSPGTSYTGSSSVIRGGVDHITDAAAAIAQADLTTAYNDLLIPTPTTLSSEDLAGQTLTPGVYNTAAGTFSNSGELTLNAQGDASAVFIFQAASTVITSDVITSTMTLTNGAQACNVFWQVGSSATIGTNSTFVGHLYALTSITAKTGATIYGQLLARNGAVTLDGNTIVNNSCITPTPTPTAAATQASIPSPPQDSEITSITSAECTTTNDYSVYVLGNFPSPITNIAVNTVNIPSSQWIQTLKQVEIKIPASNLKTFTIDIYNGRIPLLATQVFTCTTPEVIIPAATPTPTPSPTPEATESAIAQETVTATETGGELPKTGSDYYNYLLLGAGLIALGVGGFFIRKRVQS
jgi:type VI secretion system secreted protein VgrG